MSKNLKMDGVYKDKITYSDGRVVETEWSHNLIVSSALSLITSLLANQSDTKGIQYWAVGSGLQSWDNAMPNPNSSAKTLTTELGRKKLDETNIRFIDSEGNTSDEPTNKIEVSCFFEENDCNGTWREFGIFGGNATADANTGTLIDKKHHQLITKTNEMTIERTIVFTLSLV